MPRRPWFTGDRRSPAKPANVAKLSRLRAMAEQVHSGVADITRARERVHVQIGKLAENLARLETQAQQARRAGREDLAREALGWAETLRNTQSQLVTQDQSMYADEQKLAEAERRLLAKIEALGGTPGYAPRLPSIPAPGSDAPVGERNTRVIPQDVRIKVSVRDGGKCRQCGSSEDLHFDHVIPWSKGGANTVNNIQLLCGRCNRRKGADDIPAHL